MTLQRKSRKVHRVFRENGLPGNQGLLLGWSPNENWRTRRRLCVTIYLLTPIALIDMIVPRRSLCP